MGIYSRRVPINEAYFGDTKELQKLFDQFCIFRHRWLGRSRFFSEINYDQELYKFNRMCEEFWGFGVFTFTLIPHGIYNAYTLHMGHRLDLNTRDILRKSPHGPMFDPKANVAGMVFMYSGLFTSMDFTDREIFGIFLHEIGHNFQYSVLESGGFWQIYDKLCVLLSLIYLPVYIATGNWVSAASFTNSTSVLYATINEDMKKRKDILMQMNMLFKGLTNGAQYLLYTVMQIMSRVTVVVAPFTAFFNVVENTILSNLNRLLFDPASLISVISGYEGEKFSDTFAASYGYGPDLATGLSKLVSGAGGLKAIKNLDEALPFVSVMTEIITLPAIMIGELFDEHPENAQRYRQVRTYLEAEIERSDIDPKMKAHIKEQLEDLKEYEGKTLFGSENGNYAHVVNKTYQKWLYNNVKGDIRELFATKSIPDQIDRSFKAATPIGKAKLL